MVSCAVKLVLLLLPNVAIANSFSGFGPLSTSSDLPVQTAITTWFEESFMLYRYSASSP